LLAKLLTTKLAMLTAAVFTFAAVLCLFSNFASAQAGRYVVRSESFADKDKAAAFAKAVSDRGFHPVIQSKRTSSGEMLYLEMGAFDNVDTAMRLAIMLRDLKLGADFLVIDTSTPDGTAVQPPAGGALVTPEKTAKLFPYQGEPQVDAWSLLETIPAPTPKPKGLPSLGQVTGDETATQPEPIPAPAPQKIALARATPKKLKIGITGVPELSMVGATLRDVAWALRGKGYSAFFEGETYLEPSGILVGIFDNEAEGEELAAEIRSYGYDTQLKESTTAEGRRWNVYAQVEMDELPPQTSLDLGVEGAKNVRDGDTSKPAAPEEELQTLKRPKKKISGMTQ